MAAAEAGQAAQSQKRWRASGRREARLQEIEKALKERAQQLVKEFQQEWEPVTENLDAAMKAFDDLEGALALPGPS